MVYWYHVPQFKIKIHIHSQQNMSICHQKMSTYILVTDIFHMTVALLIEY